VINTEIHKAAGVIIRDRKLLVERSEGKKFFIAPGGSIEAGETPKQALVRELMEEFGIKVSESDLEQFGIFNAEAANHPGQQVVMEVFSVKKYEGEPTASSEVEELAWVTTKNEQNLPLGSIFEHQVMPNLKKQGKID